MDKEMTEARERAIGYLHRYFGEANQSESELIKSITVSRLEKREKLVLDKATDSYEKSKEKMAEMREQDADDMTAVIDMLLKRKLGGILNIEKESLEAVIRYSEYPDNLSQMHTLNEWAKNYLPKVEEKIKDIQEQYVELEEIVKRQKKELEQKIRESRLSDKAENTKEENAKKKSPKKKHTGYEY